MGAGSKKLKMVCKKLGTIAKKVGAICKKCEMSYK
jgi:hypothetical protein